MAQVQARERGGVVSADGRGIATRTGTNARLAMDDDASGAFSTDAPTPVPAAPPLPQRAKFERLQRPASKNERRRASCASRIAPQSSREGTRATRRPSRFPAREPRLQRIR